MVSTVQNLGRPVASDGIRIERTGTDEIVFDPNAGVFHLLNPTAACILNACNGSADVSDIATTLCMKFDLQDMPSVIEDVTECLAELRSKGLIQWITEAYGSPRPTEEWEGLLVAGLASGLSMFPTLVSGDRVIVKRSQSEELKQGDIIVWPREDGQHIAHRVLTIDSSGSPAKITTKGDQCAAPDPPIAADRILGKVVAVLRDSGVQWLSGSSSPVEPSSTAGDAIVGNQDRRSPHLRGLQVLDLRDIEPDVIRDIGLVEDVGLVLLSPANSDAWRSVMAREVKAVLTVEDSGQIYTGQPELVPEMLEYIEAPLRLIVVGQLFLTGFTAAQITQALKGLVLRGRAYVSSIEAKVALERVTEILSGEISVVPDMHIRWIGQSILGPEYVARNGLEPLVALGNLSISGRMGPAEDNDWLFDFSNREQTTAKG